MFPLLDVAVSPNISLKDKVTYYGSINLFHGADMDEKQIAALKLKIKELIESPLSRVEGLLLFEAALHQCTSFYLDSWQRIILGTLKTTNSTCQEISYRILKLILKASKCSSYIANVENNMSPVIGVLLNSNNSNCLAAIECLYLCMRFYRGAVSENLVNVESFIVKQMDTNSTQICEAISDCFVVLPQCSIKKDTPKDVSSKISSITLKKALYTLQDILNQLLHTDNVNYMDDDASCNQPETYSLPDPPEMQFSATLMFARIFSSLSTSVAKMLCQENSDKPFEVPVVWILEFVRRVFNLTYFAKSVDSSELRELILLAYPLIHRGTFTILEALMQNFGLIEQVDNILELVTSAIEASYLTTFSGGTNSQMRSVCWKALNVWTSRNGAQISIAIGKHQFLIQELLKDIAVEGVEPYEEPMKQNRRRTHMTITKIKQPDASFPIPDETSEINKIRINTCCEAIQVLRILVSTACAFIDGKFKHDICVAVLLACKKVQRFNHPLRKLPFPYMNEKCRLNLYKLVLGFVISDDFDWRDTMHCVLVLKLASRDESNKVKNLCRRTSHMLRLSMHPRRSIPEAVTNKKTVFEPATEEENCIGWENVSSWNITSSDRENHSTAHSDIRIENSSSLSPENHNSVENQNNFISEKEYSSSKFDTSQNSSQSDSENESLMEQDQESMLYPVSVQSNDMVKNAVPTEIEVSSEEDNSSGGEEELEDKVDEEEDEEEEDEDEEEEDDVNHNKAYTRLDQNGLASTSEDEETAASTKGENGDYSSEDGSCEEEEEPSSEVSSGVKHEVETLEEDERPMKKQRLDEDSVVVTETENSKQIETKDLNGEEEMNNAHEKENSNASKGDINVLEESSKEEKINNINDEEINNINDEEINNINDEKISNINDEEISNIKEVEISNIKEEVHNINEEVSIVNEEVSNVNDEVNNVIEESVAQEIEIPCDVADECRSSKSPSLEDMYDDLVLSENSQLGES